MSQADDPSHADHSMERLDCTDNRPYEAVEAAIHLNRYLLAQPFCRGRRVLDAACGQGYGAYLMAENWGAEAVTAVDISSQALNVAAREFASKRIEYRELDLHRLASALPKNHYDLVVSLETFEHLQQPEEFLAGVTEVLTDGGIVIISCPNDHWYYRSPEENNPFHVRKYTLGEFKELTEKWLGPGTFLLGVAVSGFMNLDSQTLTGARGSTKLMLSGVPLGATTALPTEESVTAENCRYFVGIWGTNVSGPLSAAIYPASMDASHDAHRALQVEHLREEVISLRTAMYEAKRLPRSREDQAHTAELRQSLRYAGLRAAALQAEMNYLREEFGTSRAGLEQNLVASHAATERELAARAVVEQQLESVRAALTEKEASLQSMQACLQGTQAELARLHETLWRLERTLTFRVRRFGGRVLRRLGLRK